MGEYVDSGEYSKYQGNIELADMFDHTSIYNIKEWLEYGRFKLSNKEKRVLSRYIKSNNKEDKIDISSNTNKLILPDIIYLRETNSLSRISNIDKINIGDEVIFVNSPCKEDTNRLEVMSSYGSIGYLPSQVSDEIKDYLVDIKAYIKEVVTLENRNKHARSPIVGIEIKI